jgi:hypothetical protein
MVEPVDFLAVGGRLESPGFESIAVQAMDSDYTTRGLVLGK